MSSGGSAARSASGARSFDFGADDVLCSYDDYTPQMDQVAAGNRPDSQAKDLHESRVGRPLTNLYGQPEDFSRDGLISAVEKCMKKYVDNLTRNLEGISGRLTQLELYCFKLERSIGEFRADMIREQSEADLKLKSLEKHLHEVHRSVQLIRDKQELSDTQKELVKLQLSHQESTNSTANSLKSTEGLAAAAPRIKSPHNDDDDPSTLQLALTLPQQIPAPVQSHPYKETLVQQQQQPQFTSITAFPQDRFSLNQSNVYYTPRQTMPLERPSQNSHPELHYAQPPMIISQPFPRHRPLPPPPPHHWPQQPSSQAQDSSVYAPPQPSYIAVPHLPSQLSTQQQQQILQLPPPNSSYMQGYGSSVYVRAAHPQQSFQPGSYPANSSSNNHAYSDAIEKAVSMGYPRDQVIRTVQGLVEAGGGQPFDLNTLLDTLNAGGAHRPWLG